MSIYWFSLIWLWLLDSAFYVTISGCYHINMTKWEKNKLRHIYKAACLMHSDSLINTLPFIKKLFPKHVDV